MEIKIKNIIDELNPLLKKQYNFFEGIYFHGSRLKNPSNINSDYGIVIIFNKSINSEIENGLLDIIYDFELEHEILLDYKIYTSDEILNPTTFFREKVKNEGIFYAAR